MKKYIKRFKKYFPIIISYSIILGMVVSFAGLIAALIDVVDITVGVIILPGITVIAGVLFFSIAYMISDKE